MIIRMKYEADYARRGRNTCGLLSHKTYRSLALNHLRTSANKESTPGGGGIELSEGICLLAFKHTGRSYCS